jgi:hypothetical protein
VPRRLPIAPEAPPARLGLPLDGQARLGDRAMRPILAVWEIALACDLARRHCGSRAGRARHDESSTKERLRVVDQLADRGVFELELLPLDAAFAVADLVVVALPLRPATRGSLDAVALARLRRLRRHAARPTPATKTVTTAR